MNSFNKTETAIFPMQAMLPLGLSLFRRKLNAFSVSGMIFKAMIFFLLNG